MGCEQYKPVKPTSQSVLSVRKAISAWERPNWSWHRPEEDSYDWHSNFLVPTTLDSHILNIAMDMQTVRLQSIFFKIEINSNLN